MRSFLRILAAPFLLSDGSALTPDHAMRSLSSSAHLALIQLAAPPCVVRDTCRSDSCAVYFNIWDSQARSRSKSLDGCSLLVEGSPCIICTAQLHVSVPFCSHCCQWGHSETSCVFPCVVCPVCHGLHCEEHHHSHCSQGESFFVWYCHLGLRVRVTKCRLIVLVEP